MAFFSSCSLFFSNTGHMHAQHHHMTAQHWFFFSCTGHLCQNMGPAVWIAIGHAEPLAIKNNNSGKLLFKISPQAEKPWYQPVQHLTKLIFPLATIDTVNDNTGELSQGTSSDTTLWTTPGWFIAMALRLRLCNQNNVVLFLSRYLKEMLSHRSFASAFTLRK